jgi:hypothetical protein
MDMIDLFVFTSTCLLKNNPLVHVSSCNIASQLNLDVTEIGGYDHASDD